MSEAGYTDQKKIERVLESRRPPEQEQIHGLSFVSKVFFGFDIFQVIMVVVFQSLMIVLGNFNAYNSPEDPGMGPGRRIYMGLFMGAVVYTCFLCLFAVKQQNFMEILAFLLQNFGFVTYGLIQVYHVGYKNYNKVPGSNVTVPHNSVLRNVALTNSLMLFLLNAVFIFLSWKLYSEFGWKIYKRVRFNLGLRTVYHWYQLVSCLLKMEVLYWWMYALCNSFVLLKDTDLAAYYVNLAFVPCSVLYAGFGSFAIKREIKVLMIVFLVWTFGGAGFFLYKLYGFISDTCFGCAKFHVIGKDIHDEAIMHFVYLGILNLVLLLSIFGVAYKVFSNFGLGLVGHFNPKEVAGRSRTVTDLDLRRLSHYIEESMFSVTSVDSEAGELGESHRFDRDDLMSTSSIPLLQDSISASPERKSLLSNSLPNLSEAAATGQNDGSIVNDRTSKLVSITEDGETTTKGSESSAVKNGACRSEFKAKRDEVPNGKVKSTVKDPMNGLKSKEPSRAQEPVNSKDVQLRGNSTRVRGKPCVCAQTNGSVDSAGVPLARGEFASVCSCESTSEPEDDVFRNSVSSKGSIPQRDSGIECQIPNEHYNDKPDILANKTKYQRLPLKTSRTNVLKSTTVVEECRRKVVNSSDTGQISANSDKAKVPDETPRENGRSVEQKVKRYLNVCQ